MESKQIANRLREARVVSSALEAHVVPKTSALETALGLGGGTLAPVVRGLVHTLNERTGDLESAERVLLAERADDAVPRASRSGLVAELRTALVETGRGLASTFGEDEPARFGLAGSTPRDAGRLVTRARHAATQLRTVTPGPAKPGQAMDLAVAASRIDALADALSGAVDHVQVEAREEQSALTRRDAASERLDATYGAVAAIASALLELAGEDELSERVRPTHHRRAGRTSEPTPTP